MPKSTTFADDLLNLIYRAVAIADLAENDATAPLTSIYVSLHTADPGVGGAQTTNEATYGAYARLAIARSGAGGGTTPAAIADGILARNLAGGSDGGRTVRDALRVGRNRVEIVGTTLTVYAEDDTTPAWTATISTGTRDPLQGVDPA